mmetsp:Transcript_63621/g.197140  ORF Transcript_63621/g.197140 Transcript_63621/m.197140 type:complete len:256 (+) Transcript_63621:335-1102(+)
MEMRSAHGLPATQPRQPNTAAKRLLAEHGCSEDLLGGRRTRIEVQPSVGPRVAVHSACPALIVERRTEGHLERRVAVLACPVALSGRPAQAPLDGEREGRVLVARCRHRAWAAAAIPHRCRKGLLQHVVLHGLLLHACLRPKRQVSAQGPPRPHADSRQSELRASLQHDGRREQQGPFRDLASLVVLHFPQGTARGMATNHVVRCLAGNHVEGRTCKVAQGALQAAADTMADDMGGWIESCRSRGFCMRARRANA